MKIPFSSLIWQQHTRLWVNGLTCNSKGKTLVKNTNGWTWISFGLRREVKRLISLKNCFTILIFSSKWIPDHLGWDSTKNHYKWLDSSITGTTTSKHISWLQLSVLPTIYFFTNSTGWPKSKFANSNGYNSENMHLWPHVDKAKMCLGGLHLFSFFSCLFRILKMNGGFQNTFWLYQHGVKNAYFQLWPFDSATFDLGHPVCTFVKV